MWTRFYCGKFEEDIQSYLLKISTYQHHRGPDFSDILIKNIENEKIGFVHTRLSLLDLSPSGNQPMIDEISNNILIFNGETYNFRELKNEMLSKGEKFKSSSDSEILLKGYRHFGIKKLLKKLEVCILLFYGIKVKKLL